MSALCVSWYAMAFCDSRGQLCGQPHIQQNLFHGATQKQNTKKRKAKNTTKRRTNAVFAVLIVVHHQTVIISLTH